MHHCLEACPIQRCLGIHVKKNVKPSKNPDMCTHLIDMQTIPI